MNSLGGSGAEISASYTDAGCGQHEFVGWLRD